MTLKWKTRTYLIELGGGTLLYGILLVASNLIEKAARPEGLLLLALNLAPMIGILCMAWAIIRGFGRMDELMKKIQHEALLLSFVGTAVVSIGWGFLEDMGMPILRAHSVWPMMCVFWCGALVITTRRYR